MILWTYRNKCGLWYHIKVYLCFWLYTMTHNQGMSFSERFADVARKVLPMPFTIAVLLTLLTICLALLFTSPAPISSPHLVQILSYWEHGMWDGKLMVFAMQMMLILVLGHVLALTKQADDLIRILLKYCNTTAKAAAIVTFFTVVVALFNWGLGLIFGAVFARKVGEYAKQHNYKMNYPIIGAAGYSGLMVWHGGLSGSAPLKIAEEGHFFEEQIGQIALSETTFSTMNITISIALLLLLPLAMYLLGTRLSAVETTIEPLKPKQETKVVTGAERLDNSRILSYLFAGLLLFMAGYIAYSTITTKNNPLSFLNPNYINLSLFGLGILLHGNFTKYLNAIDDAISGASGILIQFPLYFGIMGIMTSSGLVYFFSNFFVEISTQTTYPLFTFLSAGIVNIFVPSGGGQWAVQGPIIIDAAQQMGISIEKSVMAMAYGDQLTNMIQPFWALPLLAITGLQAKDLLPYTLFLMMIGIIIFGGGLLIFN